MITCKYCNIEIENHRYVGAHTRWCEHNPSRKVDKTEITKKCIICNTEFIGKRRKTCSKKCYHTVLPSTKVLISEKRKKFLQDYPEKHPWKNKNKKNSIPCNNVKRYLDERNIKYIEEFSPSKNRAFSIDIAFPHLKIGIEVNGNQHYDNSGRLKQYYQNRHDFIENLGWKLIEVHYSQCFSNDTIEKFINFDTDFDNDELLKYYFQLKQQKENPTSKNRLPKGQKIKEKTRLKWNAKKDEIFNHDIDFSSHGWVKKVSSVLNISPQKVNKWMKTYHLDFFNEKCFKRKTITK
jgi:hypothetical protein